MSKEKKSIAQNMGITRTVIRPREECDIQLREDRIGKYFKKYLNKFVFVEFSEDFMKKLKAGDLMRGVPIPLRKKEIKEFAGGEGIDIAMLDAAAVKRALDLACVHYVAKTPVHADGFRAPCGVALSADKIQIYRFDGFLRPCLAAERKSDSARQKQHESRSEEHTSELQSLV